MNELSEKYININESLKSDKIRYISSDEAFSDVIPIKWDDVTMPNTKNWKENFQDSLDECVISALASFEVEDIEIKESVLDYAIKRQNNPSIYKMEIERLKNKYSQLVKI